jgi:hypothetical protein
MKGAKTVLASSILLGMAFSTAQAEICWRLTPFTDVIRATEFSVQGNAPATGSNFGSTHNLVFGNWIAAGGSAVGAGGGSASYTLPFVGAIEFDTASTTSAQLSQLGIHATNNTTYFGSHVNCTLAASLGGLWKVSCNGFTGSYSNYGGTAANTFTLIDCESLPPF